MAISVTLHSNVKEVLSEVDSKVSLALDAVGEAAVSDVKLLVPVDTGRLRDSIDHEVHNGIAYVGTNVEYGKYVEYNDNAEHKNGQSHFLRDGIYNNISRYEQIIQGILTSGE